MVNVLRADRMAVLAKLAAASIWDTPIAAPLAEDKMRHAITDEEVAHAVALHALVDSWSLIQTGSADDPRVQNAVGAIGEYIKNCATDEQVDEIMLELRERKGTLALPQRRLVTVGAGLGRPGFAPLDAGVPTDNAV